MPPLPIKDLVYGGLIIAIILGGLWLHHSLIAQGVAKQRAADDAASAALIAHTAEQTAALQARAAMAEQAYDKEHNDNQNYRDSHPMESVRLCLSTPSRIIVSQAGAPHTGNAGAGAPTADVPKVPTGDSGSGTGAAGPDISTLLGLLAVKADNVSAELREFQSR